MAEKDIYAPFIMSRGKTSILMVTTDEVHDLEFFYPFYRFTEEGYQVDVATLEGGEFKGKFGMKLQHSLSVKNVDPAHYRMLYIPGGKAPSKLRRNEDVLALVRNFVASGKPVAAICHGPQVLASADVIRNKRIAAWPEVEKEICEAGATFVNEPTVTDGQFITARWPGDLPSHMKAALEAVEKTAPREGAPLRKAAGGR